MTELHPNATAWIEPYVPRVRSAWHELLQGPLGRPSFYLRILGVGAAACIVMSLAARAWMPGVALPWLKVLLLPIGFVLYMAVMIGVLTLLPSSVKLTDSRIQRSTTSIPARSIQSAEILHEEGSPPQLVIQWAVKQDRVVTRRIYISPKIDLGRIEGHMRAWDRVMKDVSAEAS